MNMSTITSFGKKFGAQVVKNSPTILSVLAAVGSVTTTVLAVQATPHAMKAIEENQPKTFLDKVKVAGKYYIPTVGMGATTLACIFASNKISLHRAAIMSSLYAMSDEKMKEYQEKVIEKIGPKKEESIRDDIAKNHVDRTFDPNSQFLMNPMEGKVRCLDSWNGRYFYADKQMIRTAENDICEQLRNDWYVSLNEFYYALVDAGAIFQNGIEAVKKGDEIGWNADEPLKIRYSSHLCVDGVPCLVMEFDTEPKFRFDRL